MKHVGNHDNPRPIVKKPTIKARREFEALVISNKKVGPSRLQMGSLNCRSVIDLDPSYHNQERVKAHRLQLLKGRGGLAFLVQWHKELPEPCLVDFELFDKSRNLISICEKDSCNDAMWSAVRHS